MNEKEISKEANKYFKKKFPNGYIIAGNYEGYKDSFIVGFKKALELKKEQKG